MDNRTSKKAIQARNQLKKKKKVSKVVLDKWKLPDNYSEDGSYYDHISTPIVDRGRLAQLIDDPKYGTDYQDMILKKTQQELDQRMKEDKLIREKRKTKQITKKTVSKNLTLDTGTIDSGFIINKYDKKSSKSNSKPASKSVMLKSDNATGQLSSVEMNSSIMIKTNKMSITQPDGRQPRERRNSILPGIMSDSRKSSTPLRTGTLKPTSMKFDSNAIEVKPPARRLPVSPEDKNQLDLMYPQHDNKAPTENYMGKWAELFKRVKRDQLRRHYDPFIDNAEYDDPVVSIRESRILNKFSKLSIRTNNQEDDTLEEYVKKFQLGKAEEDRDDVLKVIKSNTSKLSSSINVIAKPSNDEVMERKSYPKFTDKIDPDKLIIYKDAFSLFDSHNDGYIVLGSVVAAVRICGFNPTDKEVYDFGENYKTSKHGLFSFMDMMVLLTHLQQDVDDRKKLEDAFHLFNRGNRGIMTLSNLRYVLVTYGEKLKEYIELARHSLTRFFHPSLWFIALGRSSGLHSESSTNWSI